MNDLATSSAAWHGAPASRRDLVARAFAFRRALRNAPAAEPYAPFAVGCDGLLLSLILDLAATETLRVEDPGLGALLVAAMGTDRPSIVLASGPSADVTLLPFAALDGLATAPGGTVIVHDVPSTLPLTGGGERLALLVLSQVSAATWRSRLALACPLGDDARAAALVVRLRELLGTAELDPLFLLDTLNERRGLAGDMALPGDEADALAVRCRSLERRVRELEMSGLARQQSRLAAAALRRKHGS